MLFDMFTRLEALCQGKLYFDSSLLGAQKLCDEILSFISLQLGRTDLVLFLPADGDFYSHWMMNGNKEHGTFHCFTKI